MGRYNNRRSGRSRSYSPSRTPPPTRRRYDDVRDRRSDVVRDRRSDDVRDGRSDDVRDRRSNRRRSPAPSGLLVRNISLDSRPDDLRIPFERFGPVKDVYLPKNYYTGEPRGFGFVKFRNPEDAAEAKRQLNHCVIGGREIAIVFAEENRKTPREMWTTIQPSGRHGGISGRRTPPRFSRRRSYSRSLSPARRDISNRGRNHFLPSRSRSPSRSVSPHGTARAYKPEQYSRSPARNGRGQKQIEKMHSYSDQTDANPRFHDENRTTEDRKSAVANEDAGPSSRSLSRSPPPYRSMVSTRS